MTASRKSPHSSHYIVDIVRRGQVHPRTIVQRPLHPGLEDLNPASIASWVVPVEIPTAAVLKGASGHPAPQ